MVQIKKLTLLLSVELATFEYDLTTLKKSCNQLRSDFKHISSINLNELKTIKDQCHQNELHLKEEQVKLQFSKAVFGYPIYNSITADKKSHSR